MKDAKSLTLKIFIIRNDINIINIILLGLNYDHQLG